MSGTYRATDGTEDAPAYDRPIVGLSFYTDDPADPIAGFDKQVRVPIPEVGETVGFDSQQLTAAAAEGSIGPGDVERRYRVVGREFEYRQLDYDGFSGEDRCQVVVFVNVQVESAVN